jgi:hypothetical protein
MLSDKYFMRRGDQITFCIIQRKELVSLSAAIERQNAQKESGRTVPHGFGQRRCGLLEVYGSCHVKGGSIM